MLYIKNIRGKNIRGKGIFNKYFRHLSAIAARKWLSTTKFQQIRFCHLEFDKDVIFVIAGVKMPGIGSGVGVLNLESWASIVLVGLVYILIRKSWI